MPEQSVKEPDFAINLKWPLEDDLPAIYANQFAVSVLGSETVITFGEFLPAGLHNRSRQEIEDYLRDATVRPVAKIVISPAGLEAFYGLLKGFVEKGQERD